MHTLLGKSSDSAENEVQPYSVIVGYDCEFLPVRLNLG